MSEETKKVDETTEAEAPVATEAPAEIVKDEAKEIPVEKVKEKANVESKDVEVPAKFKKIVDEIEKMSVLDLNELVKIFEEKFGVSASAVAVAPSADGPAEEAKDTMNVELTDGGATKIAVIKAVKEVLGLGLKEAKDLVDAAPSMLKTDMKKDEAEALKKKIEEAGGKITLK